MTIRWANALLTVGVLAGSSAQATNLDVVRGAWIESGPGFKQDYAPEMTLILLSDSSRRSDGPWGPQWCSYLNSSVSVQPDGLIVYDTCVGGLQYYQTSSADRAVLISQPTAHLLPQIFDAGGLASLLSDPSKAALVDRLSPLYIIRGDDGRVAGFRKETPMYVLEYDAQGRFTQVANRAIPNRVQRVFRSSNGLIDRLVLTVPGQPDRAYKFTYDPSGHITSVVDTGDQTTMIYEYRDGLLSAIRVSPTGTRLEYRYRNGQIIMASRIKADGDKEAVIYGFSRDGHAAFYTVSTKNRQCSSVVSRTENAYSMRTSVSHGCDKTTDTWLLNKTAYRGVTIWEPFDRRNSLDYLACAADGESTCGVPSFVGYWCNCAR